MKKLKQFIIQMLIHQEAAKKMPKTKRNKKVNDNKLLWKNKWINYKGKVGNMQTRK